ncbi:MAG: HAD-IIB family hydrolase [Oscillospiraceae bacterium]|nr:HAD-IIB family hydrolase [Oscillospiraceae bacterium]
MFSDILLAVDFDHTLTGTNSKIPQRNLDAISYFMENGGAFTINTGRTPATLHHHMDRILYNAPLLLYNGSASYWEGKLQQVHTIDLPVWDTMAQLRAWFPELHIEFQAENVNYLIDAKEEMGRLEDKMHWAWKPAQWGQDMGPFIKFALWGQVRNPGITDMYDASRSEVAFFDAAQAKIEAIWGDKVCCFRPAPRIIDVQAKGVSKALAARELQAKLGRKLLVCVGDGENDLSVLQAADYAFSPADGVVADRFPNVCPCDEGSVADVIYKLERRIF